MNKSLYTFLFLLPTTGICQVMQDHKAIVKYTQLPAVSINDGSNMFSVVVETPFLQKNQDSMALYEITKQNYMKEVETALDNWRLQNSGAGDRNYWAQMAVYENKVNAGDATAQMPQQSPPAPFVFNKPYPKKPFLLKEVNGPSVISGIKIEGFTQQQDAPVKITLIWNGFERGPIKENKSGAGALTKYKYEVQYRHRVTLKIDVPGKGLVVNENIAETEGYRTYNTSEYKTRGDFKLWWIDNEATFWEQRQAEIVMQHVATINSYLNEKVGYPKKSYAVEMHSVKKSKDFDYSDYTTAWNAAQDGLLKVEYKDKKAEVSQKLQQAIDIWNKALTESDLNSKKARINREVTSATYVNLAIAYLWQGNYVDAELSCNKGLAVDFNRYNRELRPILDFVKFQKARAEANPGQ
ncbi:MAG TPA: hypothetical protein VD905_01445 [Flavobacteriales bacterium]|nr:hypothetical protein [Flavobacteriales bacterium]